MDTIDLERWAPSASDPGKLEYAGARTAQEVYGELKYRLESSGYLPDEYFLMDSEWEHGYLLHHRLRRQRGSLS